MYEEYNCKVEPLTVFLLVFLGFSVFKSVFPMYNARPSRDKTIGQAFYACMNLKNGMCIDLKLVGPLEASSGGQC